jgi:hypothetical protein
VGLRACANVFQKRKISCCYWDSNSGRFGVENMPPVYGCEIQGAANRAHNYLRGVFVGVILMYSSQDNVDINRMLGEKKIVFREL